VLHHAHGVGYPELAGSFGLAEGALRMRMSRALGKVRAALEAPPSFASAAIPMLGSAASPPAPRSAAPEHGAPAPSWFARVRAAVAGPSPGPPPAPAAPRRFAPSALEDGELTLPAPPAAALLWGASSALRARLAALVA
jgi:hypothetical protein